MQHDTTDWQFISYALADAAAGIRGRWRTAGAGLKRKRKRGRARRYDTLVKRLHRDLEELAEITGTAGFSAGRKKSDAALASALAGPLAALGEDLRAAYGDDDRMPSYDD